ncbi:PRP38 family-domain-containing protein [Dichotomocladium elegans]|nr:PRP38 family-domain-containing protein [Dichotomocladium elegans]
MSKSSNKLETWGNESTMNMNAILYQNILASPYFKSLYDKKTFHEIVDEIYNEVSYLAPFIKGTTPSTAFCCLFKMWTLRLTIKQIENLIDHADSPYIRAIGFLYLRYVCAPAQLWDWFSYYLDDEEEFDMTGGARAEKCTIGKLVRMLITDQKFQGTMLPRIPVPIARDLNKKLEEYDRQARDAPRDEASDDGDRRRGRSPSSDRRRDYRDDPARGIANDTDMMTTTIIIAAADAVRARHAATIATAATVHGRDPPLGTVDDTRVWKDLQHVEYIVRTVGFLIL